ncbi:acyl-CoA reductase [Elizabethkingia anophelis]|uniref:Long-chain-fatty-acyl-CoA reductase n=1 Tax=Elizabethkingia anophelis NUHP1 TaxID=1338011 RepID=A0A077ELH8_9FLAO|nr:acyl-CoA reductase [Elizabethkingia anophelis]AIL47054.1 hypothetical protein BD94_3279 [Elizabethkingia anophelis NUHP1]MBE9392032.1 hypothetical protein [Elizabethkingia anophelis]MBE9405472.1 hypothetical protein [Elizabethkingia anophelis]MCT4013553.1 hypothetical protein [Elizabethkingia anophelis]MDV3899360.1 hypothetical protein [Elizabethkingia anophelis]
MNIQMLIPEFKTIPYEEIKFGNDFPITVFDDLVIDFLAELGRNILKDRDINRFPAAAALAHWLRKVNIKQIKEENECIFNYKNISINPSGIVFHVCPSNVDTMFIYSLAISLLAGNKNILRVSKKMDSFLMNRLFSIFNEIIKLEKYSLLRNYITVVQYGYEEEINSYFSLQADARIIWGGDKTINALKNIPSKPRVRDFYFSDRVSFAIFNLNEFFKNDLSERNILIRKFYNDTYTFDQKGCSSPQRIFFFGETNQIQQFYEELSSYVETNYETDITSISSLKLNNQIQDSLNFQIDSVFNKNNYLTLIESDHFNIETCGAGYFYFKRINKIDEIIDFIDKKVQTITHYGLSHEQIKNLQQKTYGKGIDRIVEVGNALDFNYIWDGYNLFSELVQKQYIK